MIGDQSVRFGQDSAWLLVDIEQNESVSGRHHIAGNAIDAKQMLVFEVGLMVEAGIENVESTIEVADPELASAVDAERGNVRAADLRSARWSWTT